MGGLYFLIRGTWTLACGRGWRIRRRVKIAVILLFYLIFTTTNNTHNVDRPHRRPHERIGHGSVLFFFFPLLVYVLTYYHLVEILPLVGATFFLGYLIGVSHLDLFLSTNQGGRNGLYDSFASLPEILRVVSIYHNRGGRRSESRCRCDAVK